MEKMEKKNLDRAHRMDRIDRGVSIVFTALTYLSIIAVAYIMLNTCVNVLSRFILRKAINGSVQTSQIVLSLVAMCALPVVTMFNTHIKVDLVAERLPKVGQDIMACFNFVLCSAMMFAMAYYTFIKAGKAMKMGLSMDVPAFPHWPIYGLIAVMLVASGLCAVYNLVHFIITGTVINPDTFSQLREKLAKGKKERGTANDS